LACGKVMGVVEQSGRRVGQSSREPAALALESLMVLAFKRLSSM